MSKKNKLITVSAISILIFTVGKSHAEKIEAVNNIASAINKVAQSPFQKSGISAAAMKDAKPMPLPQADLSLFGNVNAEDVEYPGEPVVTRGSKGTGRMTPVRIPRSTANEESSDDFSSQEYGGKYHPFTTSRVDVMNARNLSGLYPYRASGKLYFTKPDGLSYICSASLIKKGLVVTAAHCVTAWGKNTWYSNFRYVPAVWDTVAPYGTWTSARAYALTAYMNGTDTCSSAGVVCNDDVAVIVINPQNSTYPGTATGWLSYGVNGYGFINNTTLINQLGYPRSHDAGLRMQRTDSQGVVNASLAGNTVWGSRQTGGSSGGPEIVNLGDGAVLTDGVTYGSAADRNVVVGVTSWGYTDQTQKQQGASPFTSSNIVPLVNAACTAYPAACAP